MQPEYDKTMGIGLLDILIASAALSGNPDLAQAAGVLDALNNRKKSGSDVTYDSGRGTADINGTSIPLGDLFPRRMYTSAPIFLPPGQSENRIAGLIKGLEEFTRQARQDEDRRNRNNDYYDSNNQDKPDLVLLTKDREGREIRWEVNYNGVSPYDRRGNLMERPLRIEAFAKLLDNGNAENYAISLQPGQMRVSSPYRAVADSASNQANLPPIPSGLNGPSDNTGTRQTPNAAFIKDLTDENGLKVTPQNQEMVSKFLVAVEKSGIPKLSLEITLLGVKDSLIYDAVKGGFVDGRGQAQSVDAVTQFITTGARTGSTTIRLPLGGENGGFAFQNLLQQFSAGQDPVSLRNGATGPALSSGGPMPTTPTASAQTRFDTPTDAKFVTSVIDFSQNATAMEMMANGLANGQMQAAAAKQYLVTYDQRNGEAMYWKALNGQFVTRQQGRDIVLSQQQFANLFQTGQSNGLAIQPGKIGLAAPDEATLKQSASALPQIGIQVTISPVQRSANTAPANSPQNQAQQPTIQDDIANRLHQRVADRWAGSAAGTAGWEALTKELGKDNGTLPRAIADRLEPYAKSQGVKRNDSNNPINNGDLAKFLKSEIAKPGTDLQKLSAALNAAEQAAQNAPAAQARTAQKIQGDKDVRGGTRVNHSPDGHKPEQTGPKGKAAQPKELATIKKSNSGSIDPQKQFERFAAATSIAEAGKTENRSILNSSFETLMAELIKPETGLPQNSKIIDDLQRLRRSYQALGNEEKDAKISGNLEALKELRTETKDARNTLRFEMNELKANNPEAYNKVNAALNKTLESLNRSAPNVVKEINQSQLVALSTPDIARNNYSFDA